MCQAGATEGQNQVELDNTIEYDEEFGDSEDESEDEALKSAYIVPESFVIHTYSCVQLSPVLSSLYSFYHHKVTLFKVYSDFQINFSKV